MLTCKQARLLLSYGAIPGTRKQGFPELGFHLAACSDCRFLWETVYRPGGNPSSSFETEWLDDSEQPAQQISANDNALGILSVDVEATERAARDDQGADTFISPQCLPELAVADAPVRSAKTVTYRSLLQNRNFRALWLGQAISTFGSYFTRVAVPIYVFTLTGSYLQLGVAFFSSLVASLCFGLLAGALVDRWDRRRTMIYTDVLSSFVLLVLVMCILLPFSIPIKLASIYAVNFFAALLRELYKPARVRIFTDVVAEEELLVANSLDGATTTFAELISYPFAAVALTIIGPTLAFVVDAGTFVLSALLIRQVRVHTAVARQAGAKNIWADIKEGLLIAGSLPAVRKIVLLSFVVPLLFSLHNTLLIPYAEEALNSTKEVGFPALEAASALGLLLGMLLLGRLGQHLPRMLLLAVGIFGYGVGTFLQGILPQIAPLLMEVEQAQRSWPTLLPAALFFAVICGAANSLILASLRTILQENTPRAALGRVYSVMSVAAGTGFAVGALLTGFGQGRASFILMVLGAALLLLGLLCYWFLPEKQSKSLVLRPNF